MKSGVREEALDYMATFPTEFVPFQEIIDNTGASVQILLSFAADGLCEIKYKPFPRLRITAAGIRALVEMEGD